LAVVIITALGVVVVLVDEKATGEEVANVPGSEEGGTMADPRSGTIELRDGEGESVGAFVSVVSVPLAPYAFGSR
jgi:hypothetical protein